MSWFEHREIEIKDAEDEFDLLKARQLISLGKWLNLRT